MDDCSGSRMELDALDKELCCIKSKVRCLEDKNEMLQNEVECYKGQLRQLSSVNDCLRKDIDDLRRCNSTLKWRKCDVEKEICRLNSAAECLRQRIAYLACK